MIDKQKGGSRGRGGGRNGENAGQCKLKLS